MHNKIFTNYVDFLQYAKNFNKEISNIKYYNGRLYSFNTSSYRCKYICENDAITPNKFVKLLGFENYNAFVKKRFSKLKDFAKGKKQVDLWYSGYFGGLIGVNKKIVNNYVATGEVNTFYDYDINKAYLYQLTKWLPTKFEKTISYNKYLAVPQLEKDIKIYFFEIELPFLKGEFLKSIGNLREIGKNFDFINSKQNNKMIVSQLRLELINKIYFKNYKIKKVYVFERGKFKFYKNILDKYLEMKEFYGKEFKRNALRLYGTFGQIYKSNPKKLIFENSGQIKVQYDKIINENASPQVAMWIADNIAYRLYNIIEKNIDSIICWNTDGLTATKKLPLQISKQAGKWKLNEIKGIPFLLNSFSARLFFKDVERNQIFGGDAIIDKGNCFYNKIDFQFSSWKDGFVSKSEYVEIDANISYNDNDSFRNVVKRNIQK